MNIPKKDINEVSDNLLTFLREESGEKKIYYDIPPSPLEGGFDTSVFHFKLKMVPQSLSGPLVLRVFRKNHPPGQAVFEKVVQNSLADQGLPVPSVHYACINDKYIGSQFLIMDFLPGTLLPAVCGQDTNIVLGKTHAWLHSVDPGQLNKSLIAEGFSGREYRIDGKLDYLLEACETLPLLKETVLWLIENRPPECEYPTICHCDFHPYNLLAMDNKVTAILDWSSCRISDPVMDVASPLVIYNAATKHIIPSFDAPLETRKYLDGYRSERDLDETHLAYYQVLGCALRLLAGIRIVSVWTQPHIQNELINIINQLVKIRVEVR